MSVIIKAPTPAARPRIFKENNPVDTLRGWVLSIPPALAPTPADACEAPGSPDESPLLDMYGETTWPTWTDAVQALKEWGAARYPDQVPRYAVDVYVRTPDRGEVLVLEVGPLPDEQAAVFFADNVRATTPEDARTYAADLGIPSCPMDGLPGDEKRFLCAAALDVFTDLYGTDNDRVRLLYS